MANLYHFCVQQEVYLLNKIPLIIIKNKKFCCNFQNSAALCLKRLICLTIIT